MTTNLLIAATLIVLALAGYAGWLHYLLWRRRQQNTPAPTSGAAVATFEPPASNRVGLHKSLYVLADALLNDKMTHTEGCLRICALATHLAEIDDFRQQYAVLFQVAEATAHFPILGEWQALPKAEKTRLTRERLAIEANHREAVVEAVGRLRERYRG